jgi:hypothetical protein
MPAKKSAEVKDDKTADDNGTPIIVRRQIISQDPEAPAPAAEPEPETKSVLKKVKIEPLSSPTPASDDKPADDATATTKPAATETEPIAEPKPADSKSSSSTAAPAEKTTEPAPEVPKPTQAKPADPVPAAEPAAEPQDGLALDESDEDGDPSKHPMDEAAAKAEKEAQEKQAALDKLVAGQTYFLPINAVEKRRAKLIALLILLLLLVAAGGAAYAILQGAIDLSDLKL